MTDADVGVLLWVITLTALAAGAWAAASAIARIDAATQHADGADLDNDVDTEDAPVRDPLRPGRHTITRRRPRRWTGRHRVTGSRPTPGGSRIATTQEIKTR